MNGAKAKSAASMLESAWRAREAVLASAVGALRIFHGPAEGGGHSDLSRVAIEFFQSAFAGDAAAYAWVFAWEVGGKIALTDESRREIETFLRAKGVRGAVLLERPERGAPADACPLFGELPEFLDVEEFGLKYRIRFVGTKHPGLFLDHAPLREWLILNAGPRRVLNTFSYTGSLSVAARRGGAKRVVTLDLSRPTVAWARENWELNFGAEGVGAEGAADFIYGDVFEWLPKLAKRGDRFDAIILDPPSFSRSPKKTFSTAKDLPGLHAAALRLLDPGGLLITSINSAQIPHAQFRADVEAAARETKRRLVEVAPLGAPSLTFPGADYLKGWIFRAD
ncbi:MAG: class I SAM-dependent rRNA methyltransferase [Bdellovibrionales bacterium]|nr:class I SAM-dependent rRNA methyltransferase [Bdellovibrionales bacterium]